MASVDGGDRGRGFTVRMAITIDPNRHAGCLALARRIAIWPNKSQHRTTTSTCLPLLNARPCFCRHPHAATIKQER